MCSTVQTAYTVKRVHIVYPVRLVDRANFRLETREFTPTKATWDVSQLWFRIYRMCGYEYCNCNMVFAFMKLGDIVDKARFTEIGSK